MVKNVNKIINDTYKGKILKIREVGDPVISKQSEEIDISNINSKIIELIEDMKETLNESGGFGIAAPQIGVNKRIIVIQVEKDKCSYIDPEDVPTTVMINPTWKKLSDETTLEYEGCLSVPSIRGKVKRYTNIEVTYYNLYGEKIVKEVKGFTARDIQHECDHLDGIVFLNKVENGEFSTASNIKKFDLRK